MTQLVILLSVAFAADNNADADVVLDALRKVDAAYESALTLSGVEQSEGHVMRPGDPGGTFEWRFTRRAGEMVLHRRRVQGADPHFVPEGQSRFADYDANGNLTVRMLIEETHHVSPEERFRILRYSQCAVTPGGTVVSQEPYESVAFFHPDDPEPTLAIKRSLWSAGRGFSPFLERITSCEPRSDGQLEVQAEGFESPASQGMWHLVVDPARSYLVTEAQYTRADRDSPTVSLKNTDFTGSGTCKVGGQADWGVDVGFTLHQVSDCEAAEFRVDEELLQFGREEKLGPFSENAVGFDKRSGEYVALDLRPDSAVSRELPKPAASSARTKLFMIILNAHVLLGAVVFLCYRKYRRPIPDGGDT